MEKVLIVYYSKTGTTKKVCTMIMEILQGARVEVDLMEFSQMKDLKVYDTVILAAPINGMQWVESAKSFVNQNVDVLQDKRIIAVYISYIIRTGNRFWQKKIGKGIVSMTKPIKPMIIKDFGGVIESEFPAFARWIFGIPKGTPMDISDDQEVENFAKELINRLS